MTGKSKKRSDERAKQQAPQTPQREASSESKQQPPEHRYRSQRTDLLEGDPAGTAFSEEMGHTPTRE